MYRNDFDLYRNDLYQNDFLSKRPDTFLVANNGFVNLEMGEESQVDGKIPYFNRLKKKIS